MATLAAAAADGVDAATLAFLTARALEDRSKEEQEEREKEKLEKKEKEKAKAKKTFRRFSGRFFMLPIRGSAASSSPVKPKLRLHWNVTSTSLRRTSGLWTWATT